MNYISSVYVVTQDVLKKIESAREREKNKGRRKERYKQKEISL